jgi:hypothetical protein
MRPVTGASHANACYPENSRIQPFKNFKKVEKKACQVSESSINEEKLGDKPADFPFKNILKKVKKKLVRLKKIQ